MSNTKVFQTNEFVNLLNGVHPDRVMLLHMIGNIELVSVISDVYSEESNPNPYDVIDCTRTDTS